MKTIKTVFSYNEQTMTDFFTFHLKRKDRMRWIYYGISLLFLILGVLIAFVFKKYFFGLLVIIASLTMFLLFPYKFIPPFLYLYFIHINLYSKIFILFLLLTIK